ncbi:unnamed protein product [Vitrella brassicaformis CCMP3155]|uniref:Uncharacterized protein n=2 Tax=Vitrella brassicaformis TaxID=1169539 RepID=A0A0G4H639_VITBC|nr:unnamed protein product [Vitrella brassicaformis CCMP3155]|eukprot:CEM39166.1 unnamed protein product [Vitrella brassicaformis CCMP3155]
MRLALCEAPRNKRALWACSVEVNGEHVSPLYWAINEGKVQMARVILRDLLAIRADRSFFYYRRDELWKHHPDIIQMLCKNLRPPCCRTCWTDTFGGQTKYSTDTEKSTTTQGHAELFLHPVLKFIVDKKWYLYGRSKFLWIQGIYLLQLVLFPSGYTLLSRHYPLASFVCRVLAWVLTLIYTCQHVHVATSQLQHGETIVGVFGVRVPYHLTNTWNVLRLLLSLFLFWAAGLDPFFLSTQHASRTIDSLPAGGHAGFLSFFEHFYQWQVVSASAGGMMVLLVIESFGVWQTLAAFFNAIIALLQDVFKLVAVMVVLLLAFSTGIDIFTTQGGPALQDDFDNMGTTFLTLYSLMLNLWRPDLRGAHRDLFLQVLLIVFVTAAVLVMLNLLIAQLANSYALVLANVGALARMGRARLIVSTEAQMPPRVLVRYIEAMAFDEPLAFNDSDIGPAGGKQVLEMSCSEGEDSIERYVDAGGPEDPFPLESSLSKADSRDNHKQQFEQTVEQYLKEIKSNMDRLGRSLSREKGAHNVGLSRNEGSQVKRGNNRRQIEILM